MRRLKVNAVMILLLAGVLLAQDAAQGRSAPDSNWFMKNVNTPGDLRPKSGNKQIVIAIVDDGMRITHHDLKDFIWTNPKETPKK